MAILQVWDAVIDEKDTFEKFGSFMWDQDIQKAFIFCADTIPARVNIGALGPPGFQSSTSTLKTPRLQRYTAMLGSHSTGLNDLPFADETAWEGPINSFEPYRNGEALTLSDPDAGVTETTERKHEVEDEDDDESENEDNDDDDDESEDEDDNDDENDDNYEEEEYKDVMPSMNPQTLEELIKFDMAWANDPQDFKTMDVGAEPAFEEQCHSGPNIFAKRVFSKISGCDEEVQNKGKSKRQRN
ncbi:hypothetical protein RB594_008172 [Gaeumannomyces avenae]